MKKLSTFLVICWYLLSYFISIIVLDQISIIENIWIRILIAHIVATIIIYVGSLVHNNSSLYDPFWSVAPIPITFYLFFTPGLSNIACLNKLFITFPIIIWSVRLTRNWFISWDGFSHEDFRYINLKKGNKLKLEFINFTGIHLIPTLQVNLSLTPLYFIHNSVELNETNFLLMLASIFTMLAVAIETLADEQMRLFKKDRLNDGTTMTKGLWHYSRHPNYFGEVMFWVGIYLMAILTTETPAWLLIAPVSMLMLFIFISCPIMDNRSLERRHDYQSYMTKTSSLIPWVPKK
jgi:steroid 5-alpha reductase family enzyme